MSAYTYTTPAPKITTLTLNGSTAVPWVVPAEINSFIIQPNTADTTMKIGTGTDGFLISVGEKLEYGGRGFAGQTLNFTGTIGATVSILYLEGNN